ncbi:protein kinase domain containing protein [Acanthamoeba castellanii str. Neff]|uniref:Protein kinase domain containing protein n=1 Tax=Acanthamoeba castellanii (strain ATCC 30010 / Neff) TaxID=1257118 RepID=L8HA88_ACACF|nr:protein kinase domain containing protein [Acanthamoeba castellanii str. Neff]ELR22090.1 protein kinase domain containing protein [Acanthamoeba castellanii str. Neff]
MTEWGSQPGLRHVAAARAVSEAQDCLYVAALSAITSSGTVELYGSVTALNSSGVVGTFDTLPLAIAVDKDTLTLFVSTPSSIQELLAADAVNGRLYYATGEQICYTVIYYDYYSCTSYNTSEGDKLYATCTNRSDIHVISIAADSDFMTRLAVWTFFDGELSPNGMTIGMRDNIFLAIPFSVDQPCAVIEVDRTNGSVVACFDPGPDRSYFVQTFGLAYNVDEEYFYHFFAQNPQADVMYFQMVNMEPGILGASDVDFMGLAIDSPTDLAFGPCPQPPPDPTEPDAGTDSSNTVAIAVSVSVGSALLILLALALVLCLCCLATRRRRKYFDSGLDADPESGVEMTEVKFTFREIDGKDLRLGKLLGEGAFGKVYKGEYRGAVVAVKLFEALRLDQADQKVLHELRSEAQMMERLSNHPSIVKFVGAITKGEEGSNFALVTEFCPRGSLYDLLVKKKKKLPLITLVRMARDAASGVLHLHKEHIVHRDLAARNILVGQNYEVYVADFGLARVQAAEGQVATTKQNFGPIAWMAPEGLKAREYSEATDAFSFGVLLWEMMVKKRPWAGVEPVQIITSVVGNTRLRIPKDCDPIFAQIMKMCWRQNPAQRPSFEKLVDMLSSYYKKLHKLHDISADAYEISDQESAGESEDEMPEGVSYEEWQLSRIKEEVKSFMKQLINERNDDYRLIAKANKAAFVELKDAFRTGTDSEEEVTFEDDSDEEEEEGTRIGGASSVIEKKEDYSVSRIIAGASNHILHAPSKSSRTARRAETQAASTTSLATSKRKAKAKKTKKEKGKGKEKEEPTKSIYCVLKQSAEEAPQGKKKMKEKVEKVARSKSLIGDTYAIVSQPEPTNTKNNNRATVKDNSTGYECLTTGGTNEPLPIDNYQEI